MVKFLLFWIGFQLVFLVKTVAQEKLNVLTVDRPGIADAPFTVAPRAIQIETGFEYYKRNTSETYFLPVTLLRTGISNHAELRVSFRNQMTRAADQTVSGLSPLTVGVKTHIINQKGWIPETDILVDVIFPFKKSRLQPDRLGHDILLLFQNDFSSKFALNYNVGLIWDGFNDESLFTASVCFNYLLTEKIGLFTEYFDFLRRKGTKEHGVDGGLTFLLHRMIQADLSAGVSWISGRQNHFISSGVSVRLE